MVSMITDWLTVYIQIFELLHLVKGPHFLRGDHQSSRNPEAFRGFVHGRKLVVVYLQGLVSSRRLQLDERRILGVVVCEDAIEHGTLKHIELAQ